MAEKIYTIPIGEAFDGCMESEQPECPFCRLYSKLESDELELILGASMMEPDVRIKTNEQGFCRTHYGMMLERQNRLGMALILQSHLDEIYKSFESKAIPLPLIGAADPTARIRQLEHSCYVCGRIDYSFGKMLENTLWMWENDSAFPEKLRAQKMFCLPHFEALCDLAKKKLTKKSAASLQKDMSAVTKAYFDSLRGDIAHFIKKFDYRYDDEPWGNAKDSVERAVKFFRSDIHRPEEKKKRN